MFIAVPIDNVRHMLFWNLWDEDMVIRASMAQGIPAEWHSECVRPLDLVTDAQFDWRQTVPV